MNHHKRIGFSLDEMRSTHSPRTVGQLVRYLRKKAGLTMGDVATLLTCSVVAVSNLERFAGEPVADWHEKGAKEDEGGCLPM
jgi:hypothetical protein